MKWHKFFVCILFFFITLVFYSNPAVAGKQDFTLINSSGKVIDAFYVSPTNCNDWEEDILGKDVLLDGEETDIFFDRAEKDRYWDIMVVFKKGKTLTDSHIDLFRYDQIEILKNGEIEYSYPIK